MGRSLKKGPFADAHLLKKVDEMNAAGQETGYQNLVPPFHNLPADGWTYNRSSRW